MPSPVAIVWGRQIAGDGIGDSDAGALPYCGKHSLLAGSPLKNG